MGSRLSAPGPQEQRFAAYMDGLAIAAGHEDRHAPLKNYCRGLLLPGERKSIEPMAARLEPGSVQATRQSLHHLVAKAPWNDETLLEHVRKQVLPAMRKHGPVVAWIVDDTGFPKKGTHSVGVARQYCGQVGKQDNCRVAVSLSVATWNASLPVGYRLYLPKEWAGDAERREETEVPKEVRFQTKPEIALDQIRAALAAKVDRGVVLADAAIRVRAQETRAKGAPKHFHTNSAKSLPRAACQARLRRGSRLRWRRSVRRRPTERAVRQLPQQQARQRDAQRGNRVWVMPLGTDPATRAGGSLPPALRPRIQDDRRGRTE